MASVPRVTGSWMKGTGCVPDEFVSPPCSIDDQGNEVCPPTDEITPEPEPIPGPEPPDNETDPICPLNAEGIEVCPPTDGPTPVPEPPPPDCPEAGPDECPPVGDIPILPEEPPGSDDNGEDDMGRAMVLVTERMGQTETEAMAMQVLCHHLDSFGHRQVTKVGRSYDVIPTGIVTENSSAANRNLTNFLFFLLCLLVVF
jgi:hypothetical protein